MARSAAQENPNYFELHVTGQVEAADFPNGDDLYCRTSFCYGSDWTAIGVDAREDGTSQMARKQTGGKTTLVWNFPIDMSWRSTNAYGWPQLVLSIYGFDWAGRDVIKGYGSVLIPTCSGSYEQFVRCFQPVSSSSLQEFIGWLNHSPPEYVDAKFPAKGAGREVTHTRSDGIVKVKFNVATRYMSMFGYSEEGAGTKETFLNSLPPGRPRS